MPKKCKNYPNLFCNLCGSFTIKAQQQVNTTDLKNTYKLYFESLR